MRHTASKSASTNHTIAAAQDRVKEFLSDNSAAIRERVSDTYDIARELAKAGIKSSRQMVRGHPFEAVFTALGVGLFMGVVSGFMLGRRR
jgi:ElaB/YqjD/DUF883 family membrane-anchored ribosome-binding protein